MSQDNYSYCSPQTDKVFPDTQKIDKRKVSGYTMIELMITVTILSILLAIGVPAYQNYIDTADQAVLVNNINTMQLFQEDFFLRNGTYSVGLANIAAIEASIGWEPQSNDGITYAVADGTNGDASNYNVTATHPNGLVVCITLPDNVRC